MLHLLNCCVNSAHYDCLAKWPSGGGRYTPGRSENTYVVHHVSAGPARPGAQIGARVDRSVSE